MTKWAPPLVENPTRGLAFGSAKWTSGLRPSGLFDLSGRYAAQKRARTLRYILRLYAKELVLHNFPGHDRGELLERMIELSLYAEEHLR